MISNVKGNYSLQAYNVLSAIIKQKTENTRCKVLEVQNVDVSQFVF